MRRALCLFPKQNDDTAEGPSPAWGRPFCCARENDSRGEGGVAGARSGARAPPPETQPGSMARMRRRSRRPPRGAKRFL